MNDTVSSIFLRAKDIAIGAGSILVEQKRTHTIKKVKNIQGTDFATSADYASEKYITEEIQKHFPSHSIFAEEGQHTLEKKGAEFEWIIDPLDGTRDYSRGASTYYVLIAVEQKGTPVIGVVYTPETDKLYASFKGTPFVYNDQERKVSRVSTLDAAIIATRLPIASCPDSGLDSYERIQRALIKSTFRTRANACDMTSCLDVAMGMLDGFVLPTHIQNFKGPHWWDIAPAFAIITSAGGVITDFDGNPIKNRDLTNGLIASNPQIHPHLIDLVQKNR